MSTFSMQPRYSKEEFARRGDEIYDRDILPKLKPEDKGKLVAIDIETGDYEIDGNELVACDRLSDRRPDAQIWLRRVGSDYVYRFGGYRYREVVQP
ncbi:MAG TPA: hypothetical protein VGG03_06190 [Thermoanaerobaculia bacterium]|jgi:hypothetical protein